MMPLAIFFLFSEDDKTPDREWVELYITPQPKEMVLPDVAQLARIITQAGNPVDAAKAILELLKEKNKND